MDCDGDSVRDGDEARAACVIDRDCDSDGIGDEGDGCPAGETIGRAIVLATMMGMVAVISMRIQMMIMIV